MARNTQLLAGRRALLSTLISAVVPLLGLMGCSAQSDVLPSPKASQVTGTWMTASVSVGSGEGICISLQPEGTAVASGIPVHVNDNSVSSITDLDWSQTLTLNGSWAFNSDLGYAIGVTQPVGGNGVTLALDARNSDDGNIELVLYYGQHVDLAPLVLRRSQALCG